MERSNSAAAVQGLRRVTALILGYDLCVTATHMLLFLWFGFVEVEVALPSLALRMLVWIAALSLLLAPVRAYLRDGQGYSDAGLSTLDGQLQRLPQRFAWIYVGAWLVCQAVWVLLAYLGWPTPLTFGLTEGAAAICMIASQCLSPLFLGPLLESRLGSLHGELRLELRQRAQPLSRVPRSIPRSVARLCTTIAVLIFFGMGGISNLERVKGLRAAALADQGSRALRCAWRVEAGEAPLEGVELRTHDQLPEALLAALERGTQSEIESEYLGHFDASANEVVAAAPLADGRWALARAPVEDGSLLYLLALLLGGIVSPPIIWIGGYAYGQRLAGPLEACSSAAEEFTARGELGALNRMTPLHDDELSRLWASFGSMLDVLEQLAATAHAVSDGNLRASLEHPGELHDAFRGMLSTLAQTVGSLRETTLELASAASEFQALAEVQAVAVQQQAASVAQIDASLRALAGASETLAGESHSVLNKSERAAQTSEEVAGHMAALREQLRGVSELLEIIDEVAARADLLALNGSLEATRAGEAGRGFALVAAEMRRLAERVTGTVGQVRERVEGIDRAGLEIVATSERGRLLSRETSEAADVITGLIAEQSRGTVELALGTAELSTAASGAARAVSQTQAAAEGLAHHARELARKLERFETEDG